jgi:hypothetical protein
MLKHLPLILFFFAVSCAIILSSCKKDLSVDGDGSGIDANLVAVWYNRVDTVGFEALADGTTRNLIVDSLGRVQYMQAKDTVKYGTSILTILKTEGTDISLHLVYRIPHFVDTTFSVVGKYTVSANKDTLHITIPDPDTKELLPYVYNRTHVGAVVVPWH